MLIIAVFAFGCASTDVNPSAPKSGTGYLDFYADYVDAAWDIQRFDAGANQFKKLYFKFDPPEGGFLRLPLAPGTHRLRVTLSNRVVSEPSVLDVMVEKGRITPLHVTLTESGVSSVQTKEVSAGGTAYGRYGRRTKFGSYETTMYRLTAVPQSTQPYKPKQDTSYAH